MQASQATQAMQATPASDAAHTVYLDLETTGLYPPTDEIVEIGILAGDGSVLLDTRVRPVRNASWPAAEDIHGISPDDVRQAPTLEELSETIAALVRGKTVVIYNAQFDSRFLPRELAGAAAIRCCMLAFAEHDGEWSEWHGNYRWQKLSTAAASVRFAWPGQAHRAINDCMATRAVWRYLREPDERARVEAIYAEEEAVREAEHLLRVATRDEQWAWRQHGERMNRFWLAWWLRTRELEPAWRRGWDWRDAMEDEYAIAFTGYTNEALANLERAEGLRMPCYRSQRDMPPYLKTASALRQSPVREGWYAPLKAFYLSKNAKRFSWLYDTRGNRLRKQLPHFDKGKIPEGYVTAHQLGNRYGLSPRQIARKKVIGYWRKPYTGEWIALYAPPRSRVQADARAEARGTQESEATS
jgi:DNA polymerase III epsilon subunit-like protein